MFTTRPVYFIALKSLLAAGTYSAIMSCKKIVYLIGSANTSQHYPECAVDPQASAIVRVMLNPDFPETNVVAAAAGFHLVTGFGLALTLAIHAIGAEIYLNSTPAEHERLRHLSRARQLQAGTKRPESKCD